MCTLMDAQMIGRCSRCGRTHFFVRKGPPNDWPKWCDTCQQEDEKEISDAL